MVLPDKAYMSLNAGIKSIYRMKKSNRNLLEWTTSEEAEKLSKKDVISYYKNMIANIVLAVIVGAFSIINLKNGITVFNMVLIMISSLWFIAPYIMYKISKETKEENKFEELNDKDKQYIIDLGKKTWMFFKDNLNENTNFLPPDNYQENRKEIVALRTSPTNIGLGLLSVISAYDLGYENLKDTICLLDKMLNVIDLLPKWNGHLYNWYNLENLTPLIPRYISTVDSGNFVGYLYVIKQFYEDIYKDISSNKLKNINDYTKESMELIKNEKVNLINKLINETDFTKLYDEKVRLFSIGFNIEENKLTDSYYDLLASEARQASLVAIAKKDIPSKSWYNLSRTLTVLNKYKGLISWSGTAFEYLMPNVNIPKYPASLLDESCKFMIMSQKEYAKKLDIPWGISESAFSITDFNNNYQYKAFGIPWLGLKRGLEEEIVVSSYGSILAISEEPKEVIENLKVLEKEGMNQKYGFYESIDFTPARLKRGKKSEPVKTYMAHHQGLILLSITNLVKDKIIQKRFMQNPEIQSVAILLEERMPKDVIITKENKEKIEKIKYQTKDVYTEKVYNKINENLPISNVISNENYTVVMNDKGEGYSKFKDILINRYKETNENPQGIFFYIKNVNAKRIWTANYMKYLSKGDKYQIRFMQDRNQIIRQDGSIETLQDVCISPNDPVEIRKITLRNLGNSDEILEITSFLEPVLSEAVQDYAHPAFNNLFLTFEYIENLGTIIIKRKNRSNTGNDIFLGVNLYTNKETIGELEFEIDKAKFVGRGNYGIPNLIQLSSQFSNTEKLTIDPIIALKRTLMVKPNQEADINLIITIGYNKEDVINKIEEYKNEENIARTFNVSRARVEAENRYLNLSGKQIEIFQRMLSYLIYNHPITRSKIKIEENENLYTTKLWEYGISGDLPILVTRISSINDVNILEEILKAYSYYRTKNMKIDLVIINEEESSYENVLKDAIERTILNFNLSFLENQKAGIFILNNLEEDRKKLMCARASLVLDCHQGSLKMQIPDLEEEYLESLKHTNLEEEKVYLIEEEKNNEELIKMDKLKYYNEYGGFSEDRKRIYN